MTNRRYCPRMRFGEVWWRAFVCMLPSFPDYIYAFFSPYSIQWYQVKSQKTTHKSISHRPSGNSNWSQKYFLSFFFRISAVIGLFSRFCEIFLFYPGKLTEIHRKILPSFLLFKKQQIFHLPSPLDARNYLAFIAAEGNVLLVNIPVSGFQFLYQLAFGKVFAT